MSAARIHARMPGVVQPGCVDDPHPSEQIRVRRVAVEQGYRLWAPTYDRELNPLLALEERALRPLLPSLAGKYVLDLACGTGRWLEKLLRLGARGGLGVDVSSPMLAIAARKPGLRGKLVQGDCLALPVRPRVADLAVCSFALGHVRSLSGLACELAGITKRGGHAFVSDVHPEGYQNGWRTGFRADCGAVEIVTESHSPAEASRAFVAQGFELQRTVEARLDERERPLFVRSGRLDLFEPACAHPAVVLFQFVR